MPGHPRAGHAAPSGRAAPRGRRGRMGTVAVDSTTAVDPDLVARIRSGVIGEGAVLPGPYAPSRLPDADYTASGRALDFVEDYIRDRVLPSYANTHSESAATGRRTT